MCCTAASLDGLRGTSEPERPRREEGAMSSRNWPSPPVLNAGAPSWRAYFILRHTGRMQRAHGGFETVQFIIGVRIKVVNHGLGIEDNCLPPQSPLALENAALSS